MRTKTSPRPAAPSPLLPWVAHTADFREVVWFGRRFTFSPAQARAVAILWVEWRRGGDGVDGDCLAVFAGEPPGTPLADVFDRGSHPTWGGVIAPALLFGGASGSYRLLEPAKCGG